MSTNELGVFSFVTSSAFSEGTGSTGSSENVVVADGVGDAMSMILISEVDCFNSDAIHDHDPLCFAQ